jgi:hypothetical protein
VTLRAPPVTRLFTGPGPTVDRPLSPPTFRVDSMSNVVGVETRSMDRSGALWCLKEREGKYITFNNLRIARQEKDGTWMAVEPGWTVTKTGPVDVRVQHDGREGVVLPFRAGMRA